MKLSIIVPVYNVEKYLEHCLTSIVQQTYRDLEIIIVNDGSTDASPIICDAFAAKDQRIKVIHQFNGGVSVARNSGIEAATGDYLTFVDSDDWLEAEMYESMIAPIKRKPDIDMVMCDVTLITGKEAIKITEPITSGYYSKPQIISELYPVLLVREDFGKIPIVSACNCLMRRTVLINNNIRFEPSLSCSEDYLFMAGIMIHTTSFYYLKGKHFYNYLQREESRSKKFQPDWWPNLLDLNARLKDLLSDSKEFDFERQLKLQLIHSVLFVTGSIFKNKLISASEKVTLIKKIFKEPELATAFTNLNFDKQSLSIKVVLFLVRHQMAKSYLIYRTIISKIKPYF